MDPKACWQRLLDALENDDTDAYWAAQDLRLWLERGGYFPKGITFVQWVQAYGAAMDMQDRALAEEWEGV